MEGLEGEDGEEGERGVVDGKEGKVGAILEALTCWLARNFQVACCKGGGNWVTSAKVTQF